MISDLDKQSVEWFGREMTIKLEANINKRHWFRSSYGYLFDGLKEEVKELEELLQDDKLPYKHKKIIAECADVANRAMMIADKAKKGAIF